MKAKHFFVLAMAGLLFCSCTNDPDPADQKKEPGNPLAFTDASGTMVTIAGKGPNEFGYEGNGEFANEAKLDFVTGVSVDPSGNVFVLGGASNTVRKIDAATGIIRKYAGVFLGWNVVDTTPTKGDNGPAVEAHLNFPLAICADKDGNVIFLDAANNLIREIRKSDTTIHKLAGGNSWTDFVGDGGPATAASFNNPYAVATDAVANVYVADQYNHVIRKINRATGVITTIAGKGPDHAGYGGDNGPANDANLNAPKSVTVDANGVVYISDTQNHVIRKITNGIITTVAGSGTPGYSGDGGSAVNAKLNAPGALAVDPNGTIYFVDGLNNVIRKVDTAGIITTYVGTGTAGYTGDGGPAIRATIDHPWGLATDARGNLYIADTNNAAVRVVIK